MTAWEQDRISEKIAKRMSPSANQVETKSELEASSIRRAPIRQGIALTVAWLIIVNLFALIAFNRLNLAPDSAFDWMSPTTVRPVQPSWDAVEIHNRWDSYWFLDVAQRGYYLRGGNQIANVVFFPLYPFLMRAAAPLAGGDLVLSGWMVSTIFLLLAVVMLIRLTREFHPDIHPSLPAMFLLAYPTAFVLNAVYSESLFLFLSLSAVFYALRRNFLAASLFTALASATRIAGLFLCVLLAVEFIRAYGWRGLLSRRVWPLMLAPAGAFAFFLYHWIAFGDFFLYLKIQNIWGRDFKFAKTDFDIRNSAYLINLVYDYFFVLLIIATALIAMKKLRFSYGLYMIVSIAAAYSSGTALGVARYSMVLFPIHLIAAGMRSTVARGAWLFGSTLLLALTIIGFVNHYWTG